jgi:tRNA-dihydrouridine synthase C
LTLLLAPMEGLMDAPLRDVLTRAGGIDRCVGEFIRVTNTLLPERVFFRVIPELAQGGCTPAGVPVRGQLLGSDVHCLAENAARLASLSAEGVDLNFGCPAKVVNRHGGGAALLDDPELLHRIMAAVRRAVPAHQPVSAKMRLGTEDDARAVDCARALVDGGAGELVVHARTKAQGYRPPAHWARIADIRAAVAVPVVANGEIWTLADAWACREASGSAHLMLGRGMVCDPGLASAIRESERRNHGAALMRAETGSRSAPGDGAGADAEAGPALAWVEVLPLFEVFWCLVQAQLPHRQQAGRLKQWLHLLGRRHPEAEAHHRALRAEPDAARLAGQVLQRN